MNIKRYCVTTWVAFIAVFIYEFLIHGKLLMDQYVATAHLWRTEEDNHMIFMFISQLLFTIFTVFLYTRHHEGKGISEGLRFGLFIGLILASIDLGKYAYMPVPFILIFSWMAVSLVEGLLVGAICSWVYKK